MNVRHLVQSTEPVPDRALTALLYENSCCIFKAEQVPGISRAALRSTAIKSMLLVYSQAALSVVLRQPAGVTASHPGHQFAPDTTHCRLYVTARNIQAGGVPTDMSEVIALIPQLAWGITDVVCKIKLAQGLEFALRADLLLTSFFFPFS